MVLADDESFAFDHVMIDRDAAHIRCAGLYGSRVQIVGLGNLLFGIGGDRELSGAILGIRRKIIESRDAVGGHTDNGCAGGIKFVFLLRKRTRTGALIEG